MWKKRLIIINTRPWINQEYISQANALLEIRHIMRVERIILKTKRDVKSTMENDEGRKFSGKKMREEGYLLDRNLVSGEGEER